jgi:sulfite exporter TauE/SafE
MFYIAFITGLLGSFHCIGMCGPIALIVPVNGRNVLLSRMLYNIGRSISYAFIGGFIGFLGWGIAIVGYQQGLSVGVGVILLIIGMRSFFKGGTTNFHIPGWSKHIGGIKRQLGNYLQFKSFYGNLVLGMLNGFLPCGLVYVALAGALAQGSFVLGALYMFLFGLGTIPLMMVLLVSKQFLSEKLRFKLTKVIPVFTVFVACFIILRGLNVGIPYVSPKANQNHEIKNGAIHCHK